MAASALSSICVPISSSSYINNSSSSSSSRDEIPIHASILSPSIPFPILSSKPLYLSSSYFPRRCLLSRKPYRVRATTLQDNEEKVIVEDTFPAKGLQDTDGQVVDDKPSESTPGKLESWVIKLEQSVNVLLTGGSPSALDEYFVEESVIKILDALYHDRHYARFYVLETIARVPYFAFMSVLHMYESFGWWRRADYLKVHFAESWNELHHLLIMEELGGNDMWFDRFLAQHIAIFYYFMTAFMYTISPRMAYHFSECVERHAYTTYDKFIKLQGEELKKLPAPDVAVKYYTEGDLYLFDEFQTARAPHSRRPKIENLYDVFVNIRDDEAEHCKTMKACQTHGSLHSPHSYTFEDDPGCVLAQADCEGIVDCVKKSVTPQRKSST